MFLMSLGGFTETSFDGMEFCEIAEIQKHSLSFISYGLKHQKAIMLYFLLAETLHMPNIKKNSI